MRPWGRSGLLHSNYGSNPITGWSGSDLVGFRGQTAFDQAADNDFNEESVLADFWGGCSQKVNYEGAKPMHPHAARALL